MSTIAYQPLAMDDWEVNFNSACIASVCAQSNDSFSVYGCFRAHNDYIGLMWKNVNEKNHAKFRHEVVTDFSGVKVDFDVAFSGVIKPFDAEIEDSAPALSVYYTDGTILSHLLRDSETTPGHYHIDFDNLYQRQMVENPDYDPEVEGSQETILELFPLPTTDINAIVIALIPTFYDWQSVTCTGKSETFTVDFTNYVVSGGTTTIDDFTMEAHPFQIAEGYDDECFRNPRNLLDFNKKLGYSGSINLYIGASHYYNKKGDIGTDSEDYQNFKIIEDEGICWAFEGWLKCLCKYMPDYGFDELVVSISMENLHIPEKWQQMYYDKATDTYMPGRTGWEPPTYFFSPTNLEVRNFYSTVCNECLAIANSYLDTENITLQLGEPWWWWQEFVPGDVSTAYKNRPPCFYDTATVALHLTELGRAMPVFYTSSYELTMENKETSYWLKDKLGDFSDFVRQIAHDNSMKFTVLFFPPSVLDKSRVPPGLQIVNYLKDYWISPNLDFLQIEDYDWLMTDNDQHPEVFEFPIGNLGYTFKNSNYFAGFAWEEYNGYIKEPEYYRGFKEIDMESGGTQVKQSDETAYYSINSDSAIYNELQIRSETFTAGDIIYLINKGDAYLAISAVNTSWGFTYLSWGMNMAPYSPYIGKAVYNGWNADPMWTFTTVAEYEYDGKVACPNIDSSSNDCKLLPAYREQWKKINKACNKALTYGYNKVYIWAGTQVRRDGYSLREFMVPKSTDDIDFSFRKIL